MVQGQCFWISLFHANDKNDLGVEIWSSPNGERGAKHHQEVGFGSIFGHSCSAFGYAWRCSFATSIKSMDEEMHCCSSNAAHYENRYLSSNSSSGVTKAKASISYDDAPGCEISLCLFENLGNSSHDFCFAHRTGDGQRGSFAGSQLEFRTQC